MRLSKRRLEILKNCRKIKTDNANALIHFYNPIGVGDWFVTHAKEVEGDIIFTGIVIMKELSWQEFAFSELRKMRLPFGEKIKVNSKFLPRTIGSLKFHLTLGEDFRP